MTRKGWDNFEAGWSGDVLRIGTIRAPVAVCKEPAKGGLGWTPAMIIMNE